MQIVRFNFFIVRASTALALFTLLGSFFCCLSFANELQPGEQYEIIGPVYLSAIYKDLNDRQLTKHLAFGSLTSARFSGPEVAFQRQVPMIKQLFFCKFV